MQSRAHITNGYGDAVSGMYFPSVQTFQRLLHRYTVFPPVPITQGKLYPGRGLEFKAKRRAAHLSSRMRI